MIFLPRFNYKNNIFQLKEFETRGSFQFCQFSRGLGADFSCFDLNLLGFVDSVEVVSIHMLLQEQIEWNLDRQP